MNSAQKVIKYLAIAFGIFLSVSIISSMIAGLLFVGSIITGESLFYNSKNLVEETVTITETIENLSIDLQVSKLNIEIGDEFRIETKAEKDTINIAVNGNKLEIKEKRKSRAFRMENSEITIYIPADIEFNKVRIETGVGESNIEKLVGEETIIKLGVGSTRIKELISKDTTRIEGGVGRFEIQSGEINNLKLDSGVGETVITARLTGDSRMESGVGSLEVNIDGEESEYSIKTSVGVGKITLNGKKCANNHTYGDGDFRVNINGGVGAVDITTRRR